VLALFFSGWSLQAIAALNAILAWFAACVHGWAAFSTSGHIRKMFLGIAGLAFFYSLAYWWLFLFPDRSGEWSDFLRPFGIFTWVIAWAIEPVVLVHYLKRRADNIISKAQVEADRVKERLDE